MPAMQPRPDFNMTRAARADILDEPQADQVIWPGDQLLGAADPPSRIHFACGKGRGVSKKTMVTNL
jgi:hypothetical protein